MLVALVLVALTPQSSHAATDLNGLPPGNYLITGRVTPTEKPDVFAMIVHPTGPGERPSRKQRTLRLRPSAVPPVQLELLENLDITIEAVINRDSHEDGQVELKKIRGIAPLSAILQPDSAFLPLAPRAFKPHVPVFSSPVRGSDSRGD